MVILILSLIINVHYLDLKSGYYVDEGMTLFLANGHYNGAVTSKSDYDIGDFISMYVIKDGDGITDVISNVCGMLSELANAGNYSKEGTVEWYDNARNMLQGTSNWMTGADLKKEIVAESGSRFQYGQVYINQALDVHPIFYYALVHTIFSLFPDIYSDAFLFSVNIFFLILTCIMLYKMICTFWNDENVALLSVAIYGFSQGFASCAVYFRMYAVLTFFVVCTLYYHLYIRIRESEFIERKSNWIKLGAVVWLGFNTHYYYILFLVPLFVMTCARVWKNKILRIKYIKTMMLTGVASLVVWPFSIYHILFGYRGTEAASNILSAGILKKVVGCLQEISNAFFAGNIGVVVIFVVLVVITFIISNKNDSRLFYSEMIIPGIVYLLIVAQIAPVISDRYLMCLFPIMACMISIVFIRIIEMYIKKDIIQKFMILGCMVVFFIANQYNVTPNYLYREQADKVLGANIQEKDSNCLMVGFDHGQGFSEVTKLSKFKNVLVVGREEIDMIRPFEDMENDELVIYAFEALQQEEVLTQVSKRLDFQVQFEEVESDIDCFKAYRCVR